MGEDVKNYVKTCPECQKNKPSNRGPFGEMMPVENPEEPWEQINLDFFGPFPKTPQGNNYCLSVVDRLSRMAHFIPCTQTVTGSDAAGLLFKHIVRLHGVPKKIVSDRDPRFTGDMWSGLFKLLGTKLSMSTACHPQTDGLAERIHRSMETMLRAFVNQQQTDWDEKLYALEFAYNSAKHEVTGKTPFELNYGKTPLMPLQLLKPQDSHRLKRDHWTSLRKLWKTAKAALDKRGNYVANRENKHRQPYTFKEGERVLLNKKVMSLPADGPSSKLRQQWYGPYTIESIISPGAVRVKIKEEPHVELKSVNVGDLKLSRGVCCRPPP